MFIYEKDGALNIVIKGNKPVENPDIVIRAKENGSAEVTINGKSVTVA